MIEPVPERPLPLLLTAHLELVAPDAALAAAVLDFYARNREHLAPWDPQRDDDFYQLETQHERLSRSAEAWQADQAYAWWLRPRAADAESLPVIGQLQFSAVVRGVFHSANLGYALCRSVQGRGLMSEALRAAIAQVFSGAVRLHRIQAAYRPENLRSAAVLQRLGFEREGLAREYLFIDGAWRDHVITALRNPHWPAIPGG